jgi:muramoyltetrapeptide carboxypeptidase
MLNLLNRRNFLAATTAGALYAQPTPTPLLRPRVLKPGNTVGVIAPSTAVFDPDTLAAAERTIRYLGLKLKWGKYIRQRSEYQASVHERVEDLHSMFRDPAIDAVFAIRGGYGSEHLLDSIDYDLIHAHPKIFLGYSDITALHIAIQQKAGLVTFHGPVVLSRFTGFTESYFRKALFETKPIGIVGNPPEGNEVRPQHTLRTVRPGTARGRLIGGNLTLISTTLGTPYEIDTRGRIFFIEDVGEEPYRIDRMLTQLRLAGKLDAAAGIVWGECEDCRPNDYKASTASIFTMGEIVDNILGGLKIPVLAGLTIGHTNDQVTLPEGVMATLDASQQQLIVEEAGVLA